MNFELRPNLNTVQLTKTVHPSRASGRTVFAECPERSRRKGSARTAYVNSIGLNLRGV